MFVLFEDFVVLAYCFFHHFFGNLLLEIVFLPLGFLSGFLNLEKFLLKNLNFFFLPDYFQSNFLFLFILPFMLPDFCIELVNLMFDILEFSLQILLPGFNVFFELFLAVSVAELLALGNLVFEVGVDEIVVVGS